MFVAGIDIRKEPYISLNKFCEADLKFLMVQLMKTTKVSPESQLQQRGKMAPVKREMTEESTPFDEQYVPLHKRSKQEDFGMGGFPLSPAQFNPLDEPSPLGLRLRKSPSLLDLIQMRLAEGNSSSKIGADSKKGNKSIAASSTATDKLKASNFPASLLKIGTWEYKSRYEGDLVAKCYFAKHKLVWEVLDGGLKNKIEIQWSDIMALKATYPDDGPGTLDVVLTRQPLFFRETNPQPRKHTLWQATSDFTGGQASLHRRHYIQCPQGLLGKHFEKLIQCDPRLNFLSQQSEIELASPYFEPKTSVFDEAGESSEYDLHREAPMFDLGRRASPSGGQSSSSRSDLHDPATREAPSPSSVMDTSAIEEIRRAGTEGLKGIDRWDQIKVPGIHPSMSMSDLVNHIENRITEQRTSGNHPLSREEQESLEILEDISRCLFNDAQYGSSTSDEKSVMSKVNSLCCLLQKDPTTFQDLGPKTNNENENGKSVYEPKNVSGLVIEEEGDDDDIKRGNDGMSRKDSVGDLLLNLPRIASLPQFFYNM